MLNWFYILKKLLKLQLSVHSSGIQTSNRFQFLESAASYMDTKSGQQSPSDQSSKPPAVFIYGVLNIYIYIQSYILIYLLSFTSKLLSPLNLFLKTILTNSKHFVYKLASNLLLTSLKRAAHIRLLLVNFHWTH